MGRHLTKEQYAKRARRIVKLRDIDKLLFTEIAERVNAHPSVVERSYRQYKEERND